MTGSSPEARSSVTSSRPSGPGRIFASFDLLDRYCSSFEDVGQIRRPVPFRTFAAAVEVESRRAVFWICMTGQVRFGQRDDARDACLAFEFVPHGTDRSQAQISDDP